MKLCAQIEESEAERKGVQTPAALSIVLKLCKLRTRQRRSVSLTRRHGDSLFLDECFRVFEVDSSDAVGSNGNETRRPRRTRSFSAHRVVFDISAAERGNLKKRYEGS